MVQNKGFRKTARSQAGRIAYSILATQGKVLEMIYHEPPLCEIAFQGSIRIAIALQEELFRRRVTTRVCVSGTTKSQFVEFYADNKHNILRAFAVCEEFRVKYGIEEITFESPEGVTYFRSHAR